MKIIGMNLGMNWHQFVKNAYMVVLTNINMTVFISHRRDEKYGEKKR
jgi:hypothetical protein